MPTSNNESEIKLAENAIEYYHSGNNKKALELFSYILHNYPDFSNHEYINGWIGEVYVALEEYDKAIKYLESELHNIDKDTESLEQVYTRSLLAFCYFIESEFIKAIDCYDQAEDHFDAYESDDWGYDRFLFRYRKGYCYLAIGEYRKALVSFEYAEKDLIHISDIEDRSEYTNLLYLFLGGASVFVNDFRRAIETLGKINTHELNDQSRREYYYYLVKIALENEEYSEALELIRNAIKLRGRDPLDAELYLYRGYCQYYLGDFQNAKKALTESLTMPADNNEWIHRQATDLLNHLKCTERYLI